MKLDLWKCDRCGGKMESAVQLGQPLSWLTLSLGVIHSGASNPGANLETKHLCDSCNVAFRTWIATPPSST